MPRLSFDPEFGARPKRDVMASAGEFKCAPSRRNKVESARYYSENPNAMIVAPTKHRRRAE